MFTTGPPAKRFSPFLVAPSQRQSLHFAKYARPIEAEPGRPPRRLQTRKTDRARILCAGRRSLPRSSGARTELIAKLTQKAEISREWLLDQLVANYERAMQATPVPIARWS
jgi:hypothetical protein